MTELHCTIINQAKKLTATHPDALVALINLRGEFIYVSPNATKITGYTPEEVLGHRFGKYIHPFDAPGLLMAAKATLLHERSPDTHLRLRHKTAGHLFMHGTGFKIIDPVTGQSYILAHAYLV